MVICYILLNHVQYKYYLAMMYESGLGVKKDRDGEKEKRQSLRII